MKSLFISFALVVCLFANEYEAWLKKEQQEFSTYKTNHDEAFNEALKSEWEMFKTNYSLKPYQEPKPIELPKVEEESKLDITLIENSPLIKLEAPKVITAPKQIKKPMVIKPLQKQSFDPLLEKISLDFYSNKINIEYNKHIGFLITRVSKDAISNFWERFIKTNNKALITQIQRYVEQYQLNDWATYLLVHKIGMEIYHLENMANLFSWYILTQMNYDVKVGFNDKNIYLLANIQHQLFQVAFLNLQGENYYVLTPEGRIGSISSIYTYKAMHQNAQNKLSFEFKQPLLLNTHFANKGLHFTYNGEVHLLESKYSTDLVEFYKTFPQSDYKIYFRANNSSYLEETLLLQLQKLLENKTEVEAVNILLRFVQTAFEYQTDKEQFNYEKVFFPEETLFYPYSDCEDRSILFTFLVKRLLNLEVVGVKYKDHMATAVKLSSKNNLEGFSYKNSYFTIADPTYINANIGLIMPKYKNKHFEIID